MVRRRWRCLQVSELVVDSWEFPVDEPAPSEVVA